MHRRTLLRAALTTVAGAALAPSSHAQFTVPSAVLTVADDFVRWDSPFRFRYVVQNPRSTPLVLRLAPDGLRIVGRRRIRIFYEPADFSGRRPTHSYSTVWRGTLRAEPPTAADGVLTVPPGSSVVFTAEWTPRAPGGFSGELEAYAWLETADGPLLGASAPIYVGRPEPSPNEAPVFQALRALADTSGTDRGRARLGHHFAVEATYLGSPRANIEQPTGPKDWLIEQGDVRMYVAWRKESEHWLRFLRPGGRVHVTGRLRRSARGALYLEPDAMSGVFPSGPQPEGSATAPR